MSERKYGLTPIRMCRLEEQEMIKKKDKARTGLKKSKLDLLG